MSETAAQLLAARLIGPMRELIGVLTPATTYHRPLAIWAKAAALAAAGALVFAAPDDASARKASIPQDNVVKNPSFKRSTQGWVGFQSKVKRVRSKKAPDGKSVAVVRSAPGVETYTIDDQKKSLRGSVAGRAYTGTAWVRGIGASIGEPVNLVVREWSADGEYFDDQIKQVMLSKRWEAVDVRYKAQQDDGLIDIYLARPEGTLEANDRFAVDAITLSDKRQAGKPAGPANPEGGVTTSQIAIVNGHEPSLLADDGSKYRYLLIRDSMHGQLAALRKAHPEAELILYKDVAFTVADACAFDPFQGGGLSYCTAEAHEDWFLHTSSGQRLASESYALQRAMNIGNPGYQKAWVDSVLARLQDADNNGSGVKYDGVFMDDTNLFPGHGMDGRIAEMSDDRYRQAMVEFVDYAAGRIGGAGFKTMANVGMDPWTPAQRAATLELARDVDVINREGLIRWGEGTTWTEAGGAAPHWMDEVELAEDIQAAGADFHGITYGGITDIQAQRYARATFLMAWDGNDGSALSYRTVAGTAWGQDWTTDVGVPTSGRYEVGQGWRRDFAAGTAIINARASGNQTFDLGGSFLDADGNCVNSVTLSATKALVMPSC